MNRKEAMKIIKSYRPIYRDWQEEFDKAAQEEFDIAVERLEQPLTLAEFLDWEEGKEYEWDGDTFKVEGNHLLKELPDGHFYNTHCMPAELIFLRHNATRHESKYHARIKGWDNPKADQSRVLWNYDTKSDKVYPHSATHDGDRETQFTIEEWAELGINETNADFF